MEKVSKKNSPTLYIVVPCYNEEQVLPITSQIFEEKVKDLMGRGQISRQSRVMFVNDGSRDATWKIICCILRVNRSVFTDK